MGPFIYKDTKHPNIYQYPILNNPVNNPYIYHRKKNIRNKYKIWARRWGIGLTALALFLLFFPGISGMDGMDGGFAMQFLGILITDIVTIIILLRNAKMYQRLANFQNIIARWQLPEQLHKEYAEYDRSEDKQKFKAMCWLITVCRTTSTVYGE